MIELFTVPVFVSIGIGAAAGGVLRYWLGVVAKQKSGTAIPGTFVANVIACGVVGTAYALWHQSDTVLAYAAFGIGMAGALSTWSTLASEIVDLARSKSWWAIGYPAATIIVGAVALFGMMSAVD